jgi:hypothetical protein
MPVINLLHLAGITEITRTLQRITRARTRALAPYAAPSRKARFGKPAGVVAAGSWDCVIP